MNFSIYRVPLFVGGQIKMRASIACFTARTMPKSRSKAILQMLAACGHTNHANETLRDILNENPGTLLWVLRVDRQDVAVALTVPARGSSYPTTLLQKYDGLLELHSVCTSPNHRRKGYFSLLLRKMIAKLRSANKCEALYLFVYRNNEAARRAYEKANFKRYSTCKTCYRMVYEL